MNFFKQLLPLTLFAVIACEPINSKEEALDSTALFDQKPVRSEGWTLEGQNTTRFDGLNLTATPSSQSDGLSQQEIILNNSSMSKVFPALSGLEAGTLRMQFQIPKKSPSGFKVEMSFLTGIGLASEVRLTEAGLTAKCGHLNLNDALPTVSVAKVLELSTDYELRILRSATQMSVVLDNEVLIKDLECSGVQDSNEEPRNAGQFSLKLFSQLPVEPISWTANEMLLHENQFLVKRITIYKDSDLE